MCQRAGVSEYPSVIGDPSSRHTPGKTANLESDSQQFAKTFYLFISISETEMPPIDRQKGLFVKEPSKLRYLCGV